MNNKNAKSYYEVLGVAVDSNLAEIRQAYLKAARKWHPDSFSGEDHKEAEAQMRKVNEAWETLKDFDKRREYNLLIKSSQAETNLRTSTRAAASSNIDFDIDPKFFDPTHIDQEVNRQQNEAVKDAVILRRPILASLVFIVLIAAFMIVVGNQNPDDASNTTEQIDLNVGKDIMIGDCVSVLSGPTLLEVACSNQSLILLDVIPAGDNRSCNNSTQEAILTNKVKACLQNP